MQSSDAVADAARGNWVDRYAPPSVKPYLRLARLDRPIGYWLLFWPCAMAVALVALADPARDLNLWHLGLFFAGSVVMRGAGCTLNDFVDRKIDAKVARTRSRPIPSGQVTPMQALLFLGAQVFAGLLVLLQFNLFTIGLATASLVLVAIYPFMKRITWWPQLFLGLAFNWGAMVGWAAAFGSLSSAPLWLYLGCILWTIGYDTIYALQDVEDDAIVGVKSTARLFGDRARIAIAGFYIAALGAWGLAGISAGGGALFLLVLLLPGAVLGWQVLRLDPGNPLDCMQKFKANHWVGLALCLAFMLEAWL